MHCFFIQITAVILQGTSILSVGMNVLRELEWAVYQCEECAKGGGACRSDTAAPNAVDQSVAFYYGADDNFFHHLANQRCTNFGTCRSDGEAAVNVKVFEYFGMVQVLIDDGHCQGAREMTDLINKQMWVPLIQGNLRYAWMLSDENPNSLITSLGHQAKGAINAAAILPIINECSQKSADLIHRNMRVRETGIVDDFVGVKEAFESCYDYLGISCADVGGIINDETQDYDNPLTRPCVDADTSSKKGGRVFGLIVLILVLIGGGVGGYWYFSKKKNATTPDTRDMPEQPLPTSKKAGGEMA